MRIVFFVFLLGHAAVHAVMWTLPFTPATQDMPFDPARSWVLGDQRVVAVVLAAVVTIAYVVAGAGWLTHAPWWPVTMVGASGLSLLLMVLYFTPWWLVGVALSGGLAVYGLAALR